MTSRAFALAVLGTTLPLCSCAAPYDYGPYLEHMPKSILVLPPLNESPDVNAPYSYLSTVTRPLAERGYYVFPVSVVDAFLKENGLPTPGEMHQVPLDRVRDLIGADAVLYLKIDQYGTTYQIFNSQTIVEVEGRLVDVNTGTTIWSGRRHTVQNSSGGQDNIIGMLVGALVSQVAHTVADYAHDLSRQVNTGMIFDDRVGFLSGHYHPGYDKDQRRRHEEQEKLLAKRRAQ